MPNVPRIRPIVSTTDVLNTKSVRGSTFISLANSLHSSMGSGQVLIPSYHLGRTFSSVATYRITWRALPRKYEAYQVWNIVCRADTPADVAFAINTGVAQNTVIGTEPTEVQYIYERPSAPTGTTEETETLDITVSEGGPIEIVSINMWELPRAVVETSEGAVDPNLHFPSQPIIAANYDNLESGLTSVNGKRTYLNWATVHQVGGATNNTYAYSVTTVTYDAMFKDAMPILARNLDGSSSAEIACKVLFWCVSGSSTLTARVVSDSGNTSNEVSTSATTPTWSSAMRLDVDATNLAATHGLQSSTFDGINIEFKIAGGEFGAGYVAAVWATEE